jgi:hypothetical protein
MAEQETRSGSGHQTPVKRKKERRRLDGSPLIPKEMHMPVKTIYFIRHGHSQGQAARQNGLDRKTDQSLRDCDLTEKGKTEAVHIRKLLSEQEMASIELVISSPLTRALHTTLLGFPDHNILIHYDLREVGSQAPENVPRKMDHVLRDLEGLVCGRDETVSIDVESLMPKDWPRDYSPTVVKVDRIRRVCQWLYYEKSESVIAIVCHYNVIQAAVIDGNNRVRPRNAIPIRCQLYSNGDLEAASASK